jgi:hypothetical protein
LQVLRAEKDLRIYRRTQDKNRTPPTRTRVLSGVKAMNTPGPIEIRFHD